MNKVSSNKKFRVVFKLCCSVNCLDTVLFKLPTFGLTRRYRDQDIRAAVGLLQEDFKLETAIGLTFPDILLYKRFDFKFFFFKKKLKTR